MAQWHLSEIEDGLEQIGWKVVSRDPGNDYDISETWVLKRSKILFLDFLGLDDMNTLPIEHSYGCKIRDTEIELYFFKKGENGREALRSFINEANRVD